MQPVVDVICIGQLSRNEFWNESQPVRPPLATTALTRAGGTNILVDPALPGQAMAQALHQRSGLRPADIDIVFLTNFHPTHRRGLEIFDEATWLLHQTERDAVAEHLNSLLESTETGSADAVEAELALLGRTEPAPDELAAGVQLFPSPGPTPGSCALLVVALRTIVVAGDAVLTGDYYDHARVYEQSADAEQAAASLAEIHEIADIIVPGHDNLLVTGGLL